MSAGVVRTRILVGLSLMALLAGLFVLDLWNGQAWFISLAVALILAAGASEYASLSEDAGTPIPSGAVMLFTALLGVSPVLAPNLALPGAELRGLFLATAFIVITFPTLNEIPSRAILARIASAMFGIVYVGHLGSYALELRLRDSEAPGLGVALMLYAVTIAKGTDIFAFFTGRFFGREKLIPHISPGKTQAGFWGAVVGGALISLGFALWTPVGRVLPPSAALSLGIVLALVVIAGDLVESVIKRSAEVKDSAALLPSFGGVLDVIDSILVTAPCVVIALRIVAATRSA